MTPTLREAYDLYVGPYVLAIKIGIAALVVVGLCWFMFSMGRDSMRESRDKYKAQVEECVAANTSNQATIAALSEANAAFEAVAKGEAERAAEAIADYEKRLSKAAAREKKLTRQLEEAYEKDKDWADTPVGDAYRRLLNETGKD